MKLYDGKDEKEVKSIGKKKIWFISSFIVVILIVSAFVAYKFLFSSEESADGTGNIVNGSFVAINEDETMIWKTNGSKLTREYEGVEEIIIDGLENGQISDLYAEGDDIYIRSGNMVFYLPDGEVAELETISGSCSVSQFAGSKEAFYFVTDPDKDTGKSELIRINRKTGEEDTIKYSVGNIVICGMKDDKVLYVVQNEYQSEVCECSLNDINGTFLFSESENNILPIYCENGLVYIRSVQDSAVKEVMLYQNGEKITLDRNGIYTTPLNYLDETILTGSLNQVIELHNNAEISALTYYDSPVTGIVILRGTVYVQIEDGEVQEIS